MRALVVHPGPRFSVADVHNGIMKGLAANGVDVWDFSFDRVLDFYSAAHLPEMDKPGEFTKAFEYEAAITMAVKTGLLPALYQWWPDIVIVVSSFFIPPEAYQLMRSRGHKVVLWATESPYEDERQTLIAAACDTVIINDPINIDRYRARNPRTFYIPHGYDPDVHRTDGPAQKSEFCFVGTGYQSRVDWLEQVDWTGVDAVFGGMWRGLRDDSPLAPLLLHDREECIDNTETVEFYRGTKASLNLYRKEAMTDEHSQGWAVGPREIELAACGTFFFREPRAEGDELFPMLPTVTTPQDFSEQLRWWLSHDDERHAAAESARAAGAERTFSNNVREALRFIDH